MPNMNTIRQKLRAAGAANVEIYARGRDTLVRVIGDRLPYTAINTACGQLGLSWVSDAQPRAKVEGWGYQLAAG